MDNNKLTGPETQTWCLVVNSSIPRCEFASGWIRNWSDHDIWTNFIFNRLKYKRIFDVVDLMTTEVLTYIYLEEK